MDIQLITVLLAQKKNLQVKPQSFDIDSYTFEREEGTRVLDHHAQQPFLVPGEL